MRLDLLEVNGTKEGRRRTFSHWPYSQRLAARLIEAGFFWCNNDDIVLCIYCGLICHFWDDQLDDPCEVHQKLRSDCPFVKSMSCCHSSQYYQIISTLPSHKDYVDPNNRLISFATWSRSQFLPVEKLAEAGFFYVDGKLVCFYCNGSLDSWQSNNNPIAEHVQHFPSCNYARKLCGEELYHQIQLTKHVQENIGTSGSENIHHRSYEIDDATPTEYVDQRLDWLLSRNSSITEKFGRSIVRQCWIDQRRIKNRDFANPSELHIACLVLEKQMEILAGIVVPKVALRNIYEQRPMSLLNSFNQSYSDVSVSFENDHNRYKSVRQVSCQQLTEDERITIERENSLHNWSNIKPSRRQMMEGGWMVYDDCTAQCPHCHMQYSRWQPDDDPLLIHQYLSPLCSFVLSNNRFNPNPAQVREVREYYTDQVINAAQTQPYAGLVRSSQDLHSFSPNRLSSFDTFPHQHRVNTIELANYGFYYNPLQRSLKCFYCPRKITVTNHFPWSTRQLKRLHSFSPCSYFQQLNDHDPITSIQRSKNFLYKDSTTKCTWCSTDDKCLVALPCLHLSVCQSCGQTKRLCAVCKQNVATYVKVYVS